MTENATTTPPATRPRHLEVSGHIVHRTESGTLWVDGHPTGVPVRAVPAELTGLIASARREIAQLTTLLDLHAEHGTLDVLAPSRIGDIPSPSRIADGDR